MFAGQMGCEACNWVLKRLIKEERPHRESILFKLNVFTILILNPRDPWQGLRYALFSRPIRHLFRCIHNSLPFGATQATRARCFLHPHTYLSSRACCSVSPCHCWCRCRCWESHISQLPHFEAGSRWLHRRYRHSNWLVHCHHLATPRRLARLGLGSFNRPILSYKRSGRE